MSVPRPASDLALVGPTATGKTALAHELWKSLPGVELVSVDAMAVYRGLDIGTEKPRDPPVAWHLVDLADPGEDFSVAQFQRAARDVLGAIHARGHLAVLVGGTGLYHRVVVDDLGLPPRFPEVVAELEADLEAEGLAPLYARLRELDPLAASRIEPGNRRRILRALEVSLGSGRPFSSFGPGLSKYPATAVRFAGLTLGREELDRRLAARLDDELARGLLDEVAGLAARPGGLSRTARQAIGYREMLEVLEEGRSLEEARGEVLRRLKAFARRQESWFRRDPRVTWFPAGAACLADRVLEYWGGTTGPGRWETKAT